ncbi:helix-turn-helix domain-containing protein, partial [Roseomonas sp. TAS13]|uniref:helix-turn-helix domain-containing protein n=1 Tax=Roseomonas sp. TAS13 TaxID=1926319 RepID=UPI00096AB740
MDPRVALGERVNALRVARGISQEDFAGRVGLDQTYVSGIERGLRNPTLLVLLRLAQALEVSVAELLASLPDLLAQFRSDAREGGPRPFRRIHDPFPGSGGLLPASTFAEILHRRLDVPERHMADLMFLQLCAQDLLLGRRRD